MRTRTRTYTHTFTHTHTRTHTNGCSLQVAALVEADWLFLLTDVDCLYTANPKVSSWLTQTRHFKTLGLSCVCSITCVCEVEGLPLVMCIQYNVCVCECEVEGLSLVVCIQYSVCACV